MAINVNTVYQTVLLVLNKEQRGYITPDEFNKTATQVQLDIFESYFDSLNQQMRIPQTDFDYSNRQTNIDNRISQFKCIGNCSYYNISGKFSLPATDTNSGNTIIYNGSDIPVNSNQFAFYMLGTPVYTGGANDTEIQKVQRNNIYEILKSNLAAPDEDYPVYIYENDKIEVYPSTIQNDVKASFIRKPLNVVWAYTIGSTYGEYRYDSNNSQNFELLPYEQTNITLKILQYAGVVIRDPQIVQAAASEVQQNEINQKS